MRISDWSSDVCSSDLRQSVRAADEPGYAGSLAHDAGPREHDARAAGTARPQLRALAAERPAGRGRESAGRQPRRLAAPGAAPPAARRPRSEEHTSELQSLMRISYAVFCLKKKKTKLQTSYNENH